MSDGGVYRTAPATPGILIKLGWRFKAVWTMSKLKVINRPSVAGAILQTPLSLIAKLKISPDFPVQTKEIWKALYSGGCLLLLLFVREDYQDKNKHVSDQTAFL